jgi:predicted polyphosphate/ATP-dependent NAD kinase
MKIGLIVNPIAGMGGRVGLKGTDGVSELAIRLGAKEISLERAEEALRAITRKDVLFFTCSGKMGEEVLKKTGLRHEITYLAPNITSSIDTKRAAKNMLDCDLILFAGGDGTARDIIDAIDAEVPILGIPAGVKIFSPIFGLTPRETGSIVSEYDGSTTLQEVLDIDEEAYRKGKLDIRIWGIALVPISSSLQRGKEPLGFNGAKKDIAQRIVDDTKDELLIIGPGTTTHEVKKAFKVEGSLLGVDLLRRGRIVKKDASEKDILQEMKLWRGDKVIIVSPIGNQGFIFGRGNQQISPEVIRNADKIIVIASPEKLLGIEALHVDTGDPEMDKKLRGYIKVLTGYRDFKLMRIE